MRWQGKSLQRINSKILENTRILDKNILYFLDKKIFESYSFIKKQYSKFD